MNGSTGNGHPHSDGSRGKGLAGRAPRLPAAAARAAAQSGGIAPSVFLGALRRRWFLAVSLGLACGIVAAIAAWQLVPAPYTASADLLIASVDDQDVVLYKLEDQEATFQIYKQTQMRAILNRPTLITALRPAEIGNLEIVRKKPHAVDWLAEQLQVSSPDTEFIRISLSQPTERPKELADLVNAVMDSYLETYVNSEVRRQESRRRTLEGLQRDQDEKLRQLRVEQEQLAKLASASNVEQMTLQEQSEITFGNQLQKRLAEVRFELKTIENQIALKERNPEGSELPPGISAKLVSDQLHEDPQFLELQEAVNSQQLYVTELENAVAKSSGNAVSNSKVQTDGNTAAARSLAREREQLETRTAALKDYEAKRGPEIVERLKHEQEMVAEAGLETLKRNRELLKAELAEFQKELQNVHRAQEENVTLKFKMEALGRDITVAETLKQNVENQLKQLELETRSNNRIQKWAAAEVPYERDYAMRYSTTALAGFGAFGGILALVVWLELMARRISTMDEVSEGLSMQVLGTMPYMPRWVTSSQGKRHRERRAVWHAALKESVDATRTMLLRDAQRDAMQVLLVASAMSGEGKTSLSCHLAMSLARAGRRTLLLDADLRRPSAHEVLGRSLKPGFCEVLRGEASLEDALQCDIVMGLSFLPAGKINGQALQLLAQNGAEAIFKQLRLDFDIILVDSSPILPVADTLLMAQHVDGVIMSVLRDVSRFSKVSAACERLAMLGVPLLGSVAIGLESTGYGYSSQEKYYHTSSREGVTAVRNN